MVDFFNIWDLITSVLSLGATFLVAYAYHQLPSKRMNALFSLLDKTDDHFKSCVEKGLLDAASAAEFEGQMTALRNHSDDLNLKVTCAKTWYQDVANMFKGLTQEINWVYNDVTEVGAAISTTSLEGRERLETERRSATPNAEAETVQTPGNQPVSSPGLTSVPSLPSEEVPSAVASSYEETSPPPSTNEGAEGPPMHRSDGPARQQESSQRDTGPPQMPADTPPPTPPHRASTQGSCSSQASADASSIVPTPRRKRSIPAHRTRYWAPFVRQPRGRWSLQSQKSDIIELLGTSSIELVDEPEDCEWEDVPDHPLEVTVA